MRKPLFLLLSSLGAILAFLIGGAVLIDWIQDISSGVYQQNYLEAVVETTVLSVYLYLGIRFFRRNVSSLR